MIQSIILVAILVGALFFTVRYFRRIFSGKGSCCSDTCVTCPIKDEECHPSQTSANTGRG